MLTLTKLKNFFFTPTTDAVLTAFENTIDKLHAVAVYHGEQVIKLSAKQDKLSENLAKIAEDHQEQLTFIQADIAESKDEAEEAHHLATKFENFLYV